MGLRRPNKGPKAKKSGQHHLNPAWTKIAQIEKYEMKKIIIFLIYLVGDIEALNSVLPRSCSRRVFGKTTLGGFASSVCIAAPNVVEAKSTKVGPEEGRSAARAVFDTQEAVKDANKLAGAAKW